MKYLENNSSLKGLNCFGMAALRLIRKLKPEFIIGRMVKLTILLVITIAYPVLGRENGGIQKQAQLNNNIDLLLGHLKGIDPSVAQRETDFNLVQLFNNQPPPDPFTNQPPPDPFKNQPPPDPFKNQPPY